MRMTTRSLKVFMTQKECFQECFVHEKYFFFFFLSSLVTNWFFPSHLLSISFLRSISFFLFINRYSLIWLYRFISISFLTNRLKETFFYFEFFNEIFILFSLSLSLSSFLPSFLSFWQQQIKKCRYCQIVEGLWAQKNRLDNYFKEGKESVYYSARDRVFPQDKKGSVYGRKNRAGDKLHEVCSFK